MISMLKESIMLVCDALLAVVRVGLVKTQLEAEDAGTNEAEGM